MPIAKDQRLNEQDAAIASIYDQLVADLGKGQEATRGIFDRGSADMGSAYGSAADQLTGVQTGLAARLGSQLSQLGLEDALPSAMSGINSDFAFQQGQIAQDRGNNLGSLSQQGTQYQAIGQTGINNAYKEKAQKRTSGMEQLQAILAELEGQDIQARAAIEQERLKGQLGLAQIRAQAADRAASRQQSVDPLDALKAKLMSLDIQSKEQELAGGGKAAEFKSGQQGLNQFLNSPNEYWGGRGAGPKFRATLMNLLENADNSVLDPANSALGFDDPSQFAYSGMTKAPSFLNRDALRMALDLYYGR